MPEWRNWQTRCVQGAVAVRPSGFNSQLRHKPGKPGFVFILISRDYLRQLIAEILSAINSPSDGVRVAMIVSDGAPVELMEFRAQCE
jgi:hypothetical protein